MKYLQIVYYCCLERELVIFKLFASTASLNHNSFYPLMREITGANSKVINVSCDLYFFHIRCAYSKPKYLGRWLHL